MYLKTAGLSPDYLNGLRGKVEMDLQRMYELFRLTPDSAGSRFNFWLRSRDSNRERCG